MSVDGPCELPVTLRLKLIVANVVSDIRYDKLTNGYWCDEIIAHPKGRRRTLIDEQF